MKKIVLPEGDDERVRKAAQILIEEHICHPILIGTTASITENLTGYDSFTAVSPVDYSNVLYEGVEMVSSGTADGIVAGAVHSTQHVLSTYFKHIGVAPGVSRVTSCFLMEKGDQRFIFADCGVNIDPTPEMLAESAYLTARFAPLVDIEARIALLSFSTRNSAQHEKIDKIQAALEIVRTRWPELTIDGELQVDAAIVPEIAKIKAPDSILAGEARILIFPDLNAGNIAYKLIERLGGFRATGPLLLGLNSPAHDLSRGCDEHDIVEAVKIACLQAEKQAE